MDNQSWFAHHNLIQGDLEAMTAICLLWQDRNSFSLTRDDKKKFSLMGNLYTPRGINYLLRTLLRQPSIRYLVIWGVDSRLVSLRRVLHQFWQKGVDENHFIQETEVAVDSQLPKESLDLLRQKVELVDLQVVNSWQEVMSSIQTFQSRSAWGKPQIFPESQPQISQTLPSAGMGGKIWSPDLVTAWQKILQFLINYGLIKKTDYGNSQREFISLQVTVQNPFILPEKFPSHFPVDWGELPVYFQEVLEGEDPAGKAYTYGWRFRSHFGVDQYEAMLQRLKSSSVSRRAVAVLWDSRHDSLPEETSPPCINLISANIVSGKLCLTYVARSQEMFKSWVMNTLAMAELQRRLAKALSLQTGPLTSFSISAHIYDHDWEKAWEVVEKISLPLEFDPGGNFVIQVIGKEIQIQLLSPQLESSQVVWSSRGKRARIICQEIARKLPLLLPDHLLYLGRELQKAENCLRSGLPYSQDRA